MDARCTGFAEREAEKKKKKRDFEEKRRQEVHMMNPKHE